MPHITAPTPDELDRFTAGLATHHLTYTPGLLERLGEERGRWFVDRHRSVIGTGSDDFAAAREAFRMWRQFDDGWIATGATPTPIELGADVGYTARVLGLWWTYGCRILEVIDEPTRFGFVYGTLGDHAERGEELFLVELDEDGDVAYRLFAMSRPGRWFAWPGLPIARRAQARFRTRSTEAMRRAVAERRRSGTRIEEAP